MVLGKVNFEFLHQLKWGVLVFVLMTSSCKREKKTTSNADHSQETTWNHAFALKNGSRVSIAVTHQDFELFKEINVTVGDDSILFPKEALEGLTHLDLNNGTHLSRKGSGFLLVFSSSSKVHEFYFNSHALLNSRHVSEDGSIENKFYPLKGKVVNSNTPIPPKTMKQKTLTVTLEGK